MTDPRDQLEPLIRSLDERRVADLSGVPRASINNWLRGVRPMSAERIKQIVAAMIEHHRDQIGPRKCDIVAEESFTGSHEQARRQAEALARKHGYTGERE